MDIFALQSPGNGGFQVAGQTYFPVKLDSRSLYGTLVREENGGIARHFLTWN